MINLSILNQQKTTYPAHPKEAKLETFENPRPKRNYIIEFDCPEFTALCPITNQPDFGCIRIKYIPDKLCIESKSLKLYLYSYRNHGAFHEEVVNKIFDDLMTASQPKHMKIIGLFRPRGGISIKVEAGSLPE